jgi:hypothetical protein
MGISRKNYEAYFLDYWENNLSAELVAELMIFLEQNPELKTEFDLFESITLKPEKEIRYSKKEELKKTTIIPTDNIDIDNYDEMLVANFEGDLSEDENVELTAFMELNPKVKLEYNLYHSIFLTPDTNIFYPNKESLQKKGLFAIYRTQLVYGLSIAASVIILLGIYLGFLNQPGEQSAESRMSDLNEIKIIRHDIHITESTITEISQKDNYSAKESAILSNAEGMTNAGNRITLAGMNSQQIKAINIPENETGYERFIYSRQTASDELVAASLEELENNKNQKSEKSFFRRFIAGITKKFIDVEKPQNKSFLEYTIDGYNFMADRDVMVDKELDENGKVIAYKVNGENISLSRSNRNGTTE